MTQKGYILIADISGYTAYLSQTELAHAQEILEALMNTMLEHIHPPIIISRVEGDGIFGYTVENSFLQGQTLLEQLEQLYSAFSLELEHSKRNTTCTCQACARIPHLGLKMIAHYGEFGLQTIGDKVDLVGSDINLTHRLAKNSIREKIDVSDYVFFTQECIEALHLKEFAEKTMVPHSESYEHIGEVSGYVYDLVPVWERERVRHRVILPPENILHKTVIELPVSPAFAWDYITDPVIRAAYVAADKIGTSKNDGRMTAGSTFHCAHGDLVIDQVILDWQPFEYVTMSQVLFLPGKLTADSRIMITLQEIPDGTKVEFNYETPTSSNPVTKLMLKGARQMFIDRLNKDRDFAEKMLLDAIEADANLEVPRIKLPSAAD